VNRQTISSCLAIIVVGAKRARGMARQIEVGIAVERRGFEPGVDDAIEPIVLDLAVSVLFLRDEIATDADQ
jgi:hypothetical protein